VIIASCRTWHEFIAGFISWEDIIQGKENRMHVSQHCHRNHHLIRAVVKVTVDLPVFKRAIGLRVLHKKGRKKGESKAMRLRRDWGFMS
jgi:hypothetical protein